MKKEELIELLTELAQKDLVDGADIDNHPCSIAIRAIEQYQKDIEKLQHYGADSHAGSQQALVNQDYNPEW